MSDPVAEMHAFNQGVIDEYRATGGEVTGAFAGAPLLLLTTTGARSGTERTVPVVFGRDGDDVFVIASKAGAPTHPAWFHNLVAHPEVTVELGSETFRAAAEVADPADRDRLYAQQAAAMPNFAEYEEKTDRVIPVVRLRRTGS